MACPEGRNQRRRGLGSQRFRSLETRPAPGSEGLHRRQELRFKPSSRRRSRLGWNVGCSRKGEPQSPEACRPHHIRPAEPRRALLQQDEVFPPIGDAVRQNRRKLTRLRSGRRFAHQGSGVCRHNLRQEGTYAIHSHENQREHEFRIFTAVIDR